MKRITGLLDACVRQAADLYGSEKPEERAPFPVRCRLQGKLLSGLYLTPGEAEGMTLQRLGEAISSQARIRPAALGEQLTILEYDETGAGTIINDLWVVGTLCFEGETDPVALLYRPDPHSVLTRQQ